MAQAAVDPRVNFPQNPQGAFNQGKIIIARCEGFPTRLDQQKTIWMALSEEVCFIELVNPPSIILSHGNNRIRFEEIILHPSFQYQQQTVDSFLVKSTSGTYGFRISNNGAAEFADSLAKLHQYNTPPTLPPSYAGNSVNMEQLLKYPNKTFSGNSSNNAVMSNIYEQMQPPSNQYEMVQTRFTNNTTRFNTAPRFSNPFETAPLYPTQRPLSPPGRPPIGLQNFVGQRPQSPMSQMSLPGRTPVRMQNFIVDTNQQEIQYIGEPKPPDKLNDFINHQDFNEIEAPTEEEILCDMLSEAIEGGNIEKAQEKVAELAKKKTKITISALTGKRAEFNILIQVEDKDESEGAPITLSVNPFTTTIHMLKNMVCEKYQFPVEAQRWIINKRLIKKDSETLSKCGIKTTGTVLFLYLESLDETEKIKEKETQTDQIQVPPAAYNNQVNPAMLAHLYQQLGNMQPGGYPNIGVPNGFPNGNFSSFPEVVQQVGHPHEINLFAAPNMDGNLYDIPEINQSVNPFNIAVEQQGWCCSQCTFKNLPTFPGCKVCMNQRPEDYKIPDNYIMHPEEEERIRNEKVMEELVLQSEFQRKADEQLAAQENYAQMVQAFNQRLLTNQDAFECSICMMDYDKGEGIMLRECLHSFCRECLIGTITSSPEPEVRCPHSEGFPCPAVITMQEIEELVPAEDFGKLLAKSLATAENGTKDSFHCRTPNCISWCFYEDDVNNFKCPVCDQDNCLTCKAIHLEKSCKEYQDDLKIRAENDEAAKKTQQMLQELIRRGEAMNCPQCDVILQKKSGCDWMRCTMCKTELCWATKGRRWGPNGNGDTSGGCKCGINGPCTPNCGNCH